MKYIIETSTKTKITIDEADFLKFQTVSPTGSFVKLKQGIINPSFVVSITPTEEKVTKEIVGHIDQKSRKFVITKSSESTDLPDVFNDLFPHDTKDLLNKMKING